VRVRSSAISLVSWTYRCMVLTRRVGVVDAFQLPGAVGGDAADAIQARAASPGGLGLVALDVRADLDGLSDQGARGGVALRDFFPTLRVFAI
jgi:hypothetical protein